MSESAPELSRPIKARLLPGEPLLVEANEAERSALAARFGIAAAEKLEATIALHRTNAGIAAKGQLKAKIIQTCAVSGEDFSVAVSEQIDLLFVEESALAARDNGETNEEGAIEVDLFASDAEEIGFSGEMIDLGEAIAQTLGLAIDPYAEGPKADAARKEAGLVEQGKQDGPLAAALGAALKKG